MKSKCSRCERQFRENEIRCGFVKTEDLWCSDCFDILHPPVLKENVVDDLAMIVRKLVRYVPETVAFRAKALDYLQRKNLMGSPLRDVDGVEDDQPNNREPGNE